VLIAPNFALGAVLLMQFCQQAARYFPEVEIIERHHAGKADAPSGTALQIADFVAKGRRVAPIINAGEIEKVTGARGGTAGGVRLHSLRLPGSVAHHEVVFGGDGQSLTIKHDSLSRESFIPGVLLAIRKVQEFTGVVFGLENILDEIQG
jgi:4-hydroxy-tetrahydrodipicolinate reductase